MGLEGAVRSLLAGGEDADLFPPPEWAVPENLVELRMRGKAMDETQRQMFLKERRKEDRVQLVGLRQSWLSRMRSGLFPLREKMTLFWHGHFATSVQKVKNPYQMWLQNDTLRANALGSFGDMVKAMSRDPAMLRWLDLERSKPEHPNENFARELMELFTLGEGNYTEKDIQESARAFTGYRLNPVDQTFHFYAKEHDTGEKTFMGQTGNFDGDAIIDIILKRPRCAEFMSAKIWAFFASENPPPALVAALAERFRASGLNTSALLGAIFRSGEFYSPSVVGRQIKGPVQWLVQTSRQLESGLPDAVVSETAMRDLGQVPFAPPNVKGWDGGRTWISTSTLYARYNLAGTITHGRAGSDGRPDPVRIAPPALRADPGALVDALAGRLLSVPLPAAERERLMAAAGTPKRPLDDAGVADLVHLIMSTPEFQLT